MNVKLILKSNSILANKDLKKKICLCFIIFKFIREKINLK